MHELQPTFFFPLLFFFNNSFSEQVDKKRNLQKKTLNTSEEKQILETNRRKNIDEQLNNQHEASPTSTSGN